MGAKGQTLRRQAVVFTSLGVQAVGVQVGVAPSVVLMADGDGEKSPADLGQSVGGARSTIGVEWDERPPCNECMRASLRAGA
mmetsp:Transcript_72926/g.191180  ORF Transcript_72926/g.191180 Transcript_72926/m.191180 type:complete len:82 (+) Transcript_72926:446-691(+)